MVVLMLLAADILVYPLFYLSSYIRRNRDTYTDLLLAVSEENAWREWFQFFLEGIREQADETFSRANLLLDLREQYRDRYGDTRPSVRELLDALFEEPVFTVSRAADLIDRSNPATNDAVNFLVDEGIIRETTGKERYREFQADEILKLLNRSPDELPAPGEIISE